MSQFIEYYPEFFQPKPVRPSFNKKRFIIRKRELTKITAEIISVLGKRKLVEAFGLEIYNEKDRYGQEIQTDFFVTNIGHGVI